MVGNTFGAMSARGFSERSPCVSVRVLIYATVRGALESGLAAGDAQMPLALTLHQSAL